MKKCLSLASLIVLAATGAADADVPSWCKVDGARKIDASGLSELYTETKVRDAVVTLVAATCYPSAEAQGQAKQIETTRQAWSKKLEMTDADWSDAVTWAVSTPSSAPIPSNKLAWSAWTAVDQYGGLRASTIDPAYDPAYLADALGARLTEAGRLGFLATCIERPTNNDAGARFAMCASDIAAFDRKKLATELRADTTHTGAERMLVRLAGYDLVAELTAHAATVKALVAKDAAYGTMFTVAETARKAWAADPALIALVDKLDDARITGSRKASDGCATSSFAAWRSSVGAIPAKRFASLVGQEWFKQFGLAMDIVLGQPNSYLAALAVNQCGVATGKRDYLDKMLGTSLQYWPGFRGPRTAAHTALVSAGITLDDRTATLEFPRVNRAWTQGNSSSGGGVTGAVAKVTVTGDIATIEFAKAKVTQTVCDKGHYTNRVIQLRQDGAVVYEYVCTKERTETILVAPSAPLKVNARYAVGVTPGMVVTTAEDVIKFVHGKGKSALPLMVAGAGVK
ncbi:MAG: hypothetical protein H0T79_19520 [Deltaproteobacteria bacterium]|nr:hypothetical protein [Deltaproteobacteria bacterium]